MDNDQFWKDQVTLGQMTRREYVLLQSARANTHWTPELEAEAQQAYTPKTDVWSGNPDTDRFWR
jgi:hypothetical protein